MPDERTEVTDQKNFPVEATHIMMFARAIGDLNPAFHNPESDEAKASGGVVAPPTFPMAAAQFDPDNPLIPRPDTPWFGSGKTAGFAREGGTGGLHAEQIFEYQRPVRPGDRLTGTAREGRSWEKQSRSGGTLTFTEKITDYVDAADELVVSVTMVTVMTERPAPKEA